MEILNFISVLSVSNILKETTNIAKDISILNNCKDYSYNLNHVNRGSLLLFGLLTFSLDSL